MADRFQYGFYHALFAMRDSSGYPMGQLATPNSPTQDTEYSALVLSFPISYTPSLPTLETTSEKGGGKVRKKKITGVSDFSDGTLSLSSSSDALEAMISGSTVDTSTVAGWTQIGDNANKIPVPSLMVILIGKTELDDGTEKYVNIVLPNVQLKRTGGGGLTQDGGENPNPVEYTMTASNASRGADGRLFSASGMNLQDDQDIGYRLYTDNPLMLTTYIDDNSTGGATLPYVMSAATPVTGDDAPNSSTTNGVTAAVTSYNAASGAVAFTAAAAGAKWVFLYEVANGKYTAVS